MIMRHSAVRLRECRRAHRDVGERLQQRCIEGGERQLLPNGELDEQRVVHRNFGVMGSHERCLPTNAGGAVSPYFQLLSGSAQRTMEARRCLRIQGLMLIERTGTLPQSVSTRLGN